MSSISGLAKWVAICCVCMSAARTDAAVPSVKDLAAAIKKQRDAFSTHHGYKLKFDVSSKSALDQKSAFVYRTLSVTDVRRGPDMSTTVVIPAGSWRGHENVPETTLRRTWYKGFAVDSNGYLVQICPNILTQHFQYHYLTDYNHINTYKYYPKPAGNFAAGEPSQPFLPDVIEEALDSYTVRDRKEQVGGVDCWIVERPGMDQVWVDAEGLVRKRQIYWIEGGPLSVVTTSSDFQTVADGVKLPRVTIVQHFLNPSVVEKSLWEQVNFELTIRLNEFAFGSIKDTEFLIEPEEGNLVTDYIRRVEYKVPAAGEEPFEQAIAMSLAQKPGRTATLILANGLLFGMLLNLNLVRRILAARK